MQYTPISRAQKWVWPNFRCALCTIKHPPSPIPRYAPDNNNNNNNAY